MSTLNTKIFNSALAAAQNADPNATQLVQEKRRIEAFEADGFDQADYATWSLHYSAHVNNLARIASQQTPSEIAAAAAATAKAKTA